MKFIDFFKENNNRKINIYCDMDGVVAEYDIGNFDYSTIRPLNSVISKLKNLSEKNNINLYILTICKSNEIITEKIGWLNKYMSFLDIKNVIFISKEEYKGISSKELKSSYLNENINKDVINVVIDDDNEIIKYLRKENKDLIIFQISSLID